MPNESRSRRRAGRFAARMLLSEAPSVAGELAALTASAPFLNLAPRGDGHPVLVLPGFTASDRSTRVLRRFLAGRGYHAMPWTLGRNLGPAMPDLPTQLNALVESAWTDHGEQKISLVGWSLGGVYARILAHFHPEKIRNVITLGSPYGGGRDVEVDDRAASEMGSTPREHLYRLAASPVATIPTTSIYTRRDAVVPWRIATEPASPATENIEVMTTHLGLGFSPAVLYAISDRLARAEGEWKPFGRRGWKAALYGPANVDAPAQAA